MYKVCIITIIFKYRDNVIYQIRLPGIILPSTISLYLSLPLSPSLSLIAHAQHFHHQIQQLSTLLHCTTNCVYGRFPDHDLSFSHELGQTTEYTCDIYGALMCLSISHEFTDNNRYYKDSGTSTTRTTRSHIDHIYFFVMVLQLFSPTLENF